MRRIVAFDRLAADGYFTDADGGIGWVVPDEEFDRSVGGNLGGAGTMLFGRRTYEMFESFWPHAVDSPEARDPHAPGSLSPEQRAMGRWINEATKYVFSRTRKDVTWKNSHLLGELDPREVERIKQEPGEGGDILIFGSGSIVSGLTRHGLIDEYWFVVCPLLLGSGRPLVSGVPTSTRLDLQEVRQYPSGNVSLRYTRRER